jgi:uncharacterized protein (TIGR02996 family)
VDEFSACPVCNNDHLSRRHDYDESRGEFVVTTVCLSGCEMVRMSEWLIAPGTLENKYSWRIGVLAGDFYISRRELVVARRLGESAPIFISRDPRYNRAILEAQKMWERPEAMAFVRACQDAPNDHAPLLVFCDWLEERNLCPQTQKAIRQLQEAARAGH